MIIATGVSDKKPNMRDLEEAIDETKLRLCPIYDGFEAVNKKVAVIGFGESGAGEARFLTTWTNDVYLLSLYAPLVLDNDEREYLKRLGVKIVDQPVIGITPR